MDIQKILNWSVFLSIWKILDLGISLAHKNTGLGFAWADDAHGKAGSSFGSRDECGGGDDAVDGAQCLRGHEYRIAALCSVVGRGEALPSRFLHRFDWDSLDAAELLLHLSASKAAKEGLTLYPASTHLLRRLCAGFDCIGATFLAFQNLLPNTTALWRWRCWPWPRLRNPRELSLLWVNWVGEYWAPVVVKHESACDYGPAEDATSSWVRSKVNGLYLGALKL